MFSRRASAGRRPSVAGRVRVGAPFPLSRRNAGLLAAPPDLAAVLLVAFGLALVAAEMVLPTFGMLGAVGAAFLALGWLLLLGVAMPFVPSVPFVLACAAAAGALALVAAVAVWRAHRRPVVIGRDALIGATGTVASWEKTRGLVRVEGDRWQALCAVPLAPGDRVRVTGRENLTLRVEPEATRGS